MRTRGYVTAAASGGMITVLRPGRTEPEVVTVDRTVGAAAVAGDWVVVDDDGSLPIVVALLGTGAGSPTTQQAPIPAPAESHGSDVMPPTWSGTWRGGGWRSSWSDLVQGDGGWGISRGAAFYGLRPSSLGHTFTSGSVHLLRESYGVYGSGAPTLVLLADKAPGAAYPTILRTMAGPSLPHVGSEADAALPPEWLADLASGAAGGVGTYVPTSTPYMRLDGPAMRLSLTW